MRTATCAALLAAGLLCARAAAAGFIGPRDGLARLATVGDAAAPDPVAARAAAEPAVADSVAVSAPATDSAGGPGASGGDVTAASPAVPTVPPGLFPSGCEPAEVRERLSRVTDAEVSRACGNISSPWAFRGRVGRGLTLRDFGRRKADPGWTRNVAALLLRDATVDTAYRVPSVKSPCETRTGLPIYLVRLNGPDRPTFALFRFDRAVVQLFDAELPLGMIDLGARADTLWAMMAQVLDDDPLLRRPRPVVAPEDAAPRMHGDRVEVVGFPEPVERVAPRYPEDARRTNTEGTVWVQALIGADGEVRDAIVRAGPPLLRDASLDALWQWRFRPATRPGGVPVAVWVLVPVKFTLR